MEVKNWMKRPRLAVVALLAACSTYKYPAPPSPRDATIVNASMGRTWDAVIDLFAARNIPIRTIDRVSGIITTEQLTVGPEGREYGDCGKNGRIRYRPNRASYNVLVRGDSTGSRVKVTVRWIFLTSKFDTFECSTQHVWEQAFESDVKSAAEGHAPPALAAPRRADSTQAVATMPDSASSSNARPNSMLLTFEGFRRAIGDMKRKGMVLDYREIALERLEVELSARALVEPTLEYLLTRLYLAYGATINGAGHQALVLRANGQPVGRYSSLGLQWDASARP